MRWCASRELAFAEDGVRGHASVGLGGTRGQAPAAASGPEAMGAAGTSSAGAGRRRSWARAAELAARRRDSRAEMAESYCVKAQARGGAGRGIEHLGAGGAGLLVARCRELAGVAQGASSIDRRSGD
jgi:hypothetical protein